MRQALVLLAVAGMVGGVLAPAAHAEGTCASGAAAARLSEEAAALRRLAGEGKARIAELQGDFDAALTVLDAADRALAAGRFYVALENVVYARNVLEPLRFVESQTPTLEALDEKLYEQGRAALHARMDEQRTAIDRSSAPTLPAAVRAIREEARLKAKVLSHTVPMWGGTGDYLGALYYGAEGLSWARLAAFLEQTGFPAPASATSFPAVSAKIDAYERELIAAYKPPVSADFHREFIMASAALKTASELDLAGSKEGALFQYLRARSFGALLIRAGSPAPVLDTLTTTAAQSRARVEEIALDASIACLFQEEAESALAAAREGRDPERAARRAAVLLEDVLPEYSRVLSGKPAPAPTAASSPSEVTVTLVRWPYT